MFELKLPKNLQDRVILYLNTCFDKSLDYHNSDPFETISNNLK